MSVAKTCNMHLKVNLDSWDKECIPNSINQIEVVATSEEEEEIEVKEAWAEVDTCNLLKTCPNLTNNSSSLHKCLCQILNSTNFLSKCLLV